MNSITREIIEHELADIQECHARAVDQIDDLRERLKKAEEARDEYVEQIGALKEDLASEPTRVTYNVYIDAARRASA